MGEAEGEYRRGIEERKLGVQVICSKVCSGYAALLELLELESSKL